MRVSKKALDNQIDEPKENDRKRKRSAIENTRNTSAESISTARNYMLRNRTVKANENDRKRERSAIDDSGNTRTESKSAAKKHGVKSSTAAAEDNDNGKNRKRKRIPIVNTRETSAESISHMIVAYHFQLKNLCT